MPFPQQIGTKIYGWQDGDKWYLSKSPREKNGPKNTYDTQQAAMTEAAQRGMRVEWSTQ